MVMDPNNDFDCINTIKIDGVDVNKLNINAAIVDFDYDLNKNMTFSEDFIWKSNYHVFLAFMSYWRRYPEEKCSVISKNTVQKTIGDLYKYENGVPLKQVDVPSGPCIPGQMRLFMDVNGEFYPCERVSELSEVMNIGNLMRGFDFEKAGAILNFSRLTEEMCGKCWAFRHCTQCAKKADDGTKLLSKKMKLKNCKETLNYAYNEMMRYLVFIETPEYYFDQTKIL